MAGALVVMRWFLVILGTIVAIYTAVWLAVRVSFYRIRFKQQRRKAYLWQHYKNLQKKEIQQELTKDQLQPLRTLRRWLDGEVPYMMVENFFWHKVLAQRETSSALLQPVIAQPLFILHEESRDLDNTPLRRHLFITNQRLLLIENTQEESLFFKEIKELHFYIDTIEMILDGDQRFILHGYLQPEVVVRCYQMIVYLWQNNEKK